jgi:chemotaxis protein histidine kinase CheA
VDEVLEHEPIVVKSFDAPTGAPPIFTGATVRPDGRPVLLLDPMSVG